VHRLLLLGNSIAELGAEPGGYVWLLERWLAAFYPDDAIQFVNAGDEDLDGPENRRLVGYVRAERDLAARHGCLFVDLNTPFRRVVAAWRRHGPTRNLLTTDGVHLNAAGNHLMAATILRGLGAPSVDVALGPEGP
jgi:hypothetical protein